MRRVFLCAAAACFVSGTACFAAGFVEIVRIILMHPAVNEGLWQATDAQSWAWRFAAFYATGFVILWFTPIKGAPANRGV